MGNSNSKPWTKIAQAIKSKFEQTSVRQIALAALVLVGLYGILSINISPVSYHLQVGEVVRQDIRVPRDMENKAQTQREQEQAASFAEEEALSDPHNYVIDHAKIIAIDEQLTELFEILSLNREQIDEIDEIEIEKVQLEIVKNAEVSLSSEAVELLLTTEPEEFNNFMATTKQIILDQMDEKIFADDELQALENVEIRIAQSSISPTLQEIANSISSQVIESNLVLDRDRVEQARLDAIDKVEPVMVKAGEIIVSDGTVVQQEHVQLLRDLGLYREGVDYWALTGLLIIVSLLLIVFGFSLYKYKPDTVLSENRLAFIGSILIVITFLTKVLSFTDWLLIGYLTPIALAGMLVTMLLNSRTAILTVVVLSVISGIIFHSLPLIILGLIGGLIAILGVSRVSQRTELMRAGLVVGIGNFLVMIAIGLLQRDSSLLIHSYLGLINGLICSIIAIGSLPYFESIFGITSAIRLLELSNPNHPLLRRLLMETPGTYHHSILVGNLAEAAADVVGADGLLARVGSTYHDVGKIRRPYFFVENQIGGVNPHDKIAPSLSTLILTSHVKDGLELAREYKLPMTITRFIAEHHGTDLIKFFYHRAQESNGESVEEKDFRYPGPKPQTKETAIVSLADAVEAAVRSVVKPTPTKIEALVRKIIRERMEYGQLDESELSFKDLNKIADAFVKVLVGIFHARVEYPENITREEIEGKSTS